MLAIVGGIFVMEALSVIEHPDCGKCEYEFFCNSGCPTDRIKKGSDAGKAHECRIIKAVMSDLQKRNIPLLTGKS